MNDLATETWKRLRELLKGEGVSAADRELLASIAEDAAHVYLQAASGFWTAAKVKTEKAHIEAQLKSLKSIGAAKAAKLVWRAVDIAVSVLTKAIVAV